MASSGYISITLVGGQASGETCTIADMINSVRVPIPQSPITMINKADLHKEVTFGCLTYTKRQYRDKRGTIRTFLIYEHMTKEEAEIELYLLGIIDVDGNFEKC